MTFVFGVRDVNRVVRPEDKDGKEGARSGCPQIAPMRALGLRLEPTRAQLVDITRPSYTEGRPWDGAGLTMKPLGERVLARSAASATVDVNVRVEGNRLKVSVAGETFELPIDRPESGFYGFLIEQPGYVALRQLDCGGLRPGRSCKKVPASPPTRNANGDNAMASLAGLKTKTASTSKTTK